MTRNAIEDIDVKQRRSVYGPVSSAMVVSGYALTWILALLLIPEYALRLASSWHHRHDASMVAAKPAYEHAPWVGQFAEEYVQYLKTSGSYKGVYNYAPFTVVDSEPFHSQYMNIDVAAQGIVRRSTAANCEPKSLRVWAFGGSTTFGIGVPDDMTWPSYLVEDMRKLTGRC